jgi:hypothetical protein
MGVSSHGWYRLFVALTLTALAACSVKPVTYTPAGDPALTGLDGGAAIDGPAAMATVTIALTGTGTGTVTADGSTCPGACTLRVPVNTKLQLSALAAATSVFAGWDGACSATGDCAFTVTGDATVTAAFAAFSDLTVSVAGHGTVASVPDGIACGAACTASYPPGTAVTLSAVPADDSMFTGWSGGCTGTGDCQVTLDTAVSVTATFALLPPPQFAVTMTTDGNGTGAITGGDGQVGSCGVNCLLYTAGSVVTFAAAPGTNAVFVGWGGPCTGTGACTFTVTADTTLTATFASNNDLIVTMAGTGRGQVSLMPGIVCTADCDQTYAPNTVVTLTATPASDSTFTGWSGGGCTGTGACQVKLSAATAVTATFTLQQRALQVVLAGAGSGRVTSSPAGISCGAQCSKSFDAHTQVTLTAAAGTNSAFTGWSGGGCTGTGTCVVTLDAAATVTATFTIPRFALTVSIIGDGEGQVFSSPAGIDCPSGDCTVSYAAGTVVTLSESILNGATFLGWSTNCASIGSGMCRLTMTGPLTVTARFKIITGPCGVQATSATQPCLTADEASATCCVASNNELRAFLAALAAAGKIAPVD